MRKVLFLYPNEYMVGPAPSNLAILSACLKNAGFDTKLFDCSLYKSNDSEDDKRANLGQVKRSKIDDYIQPINTNIYDDFIKIVDEYNPDIIAVTMIDSTIRLALTFLEKIINRNIPIIAGGVGATFNYEKILKSGLIKYVCRGEGEEAIVELCTGLCNGKDCSGISNICSIVNGNIIVNKMRDPISLDKVPLPDFSIYDYNRFYRPFQGNVTRTLQIDLDRGCPFSCTYCAAPAIKKNYTDDTNTKYYRVKKLDKFFSETKELIKKYNLDFLWISSETLLALNDNKFMEFAKRYIKEINLPFWSSSRLDTFTEEKTKLLYEMGCKSLSIGLEHGNESFRKNILNKHISNDKIIQSFKILAKYKIHPTINNVIGFPDETRENIFETIYLNREISSILNGDHSINFFIFLPFTGTYLRKICIDKGYIKESEDIPFSFLDNSILDMPSISRSEILGLEKTMLLYIMLPESYFPDIKIAEKDDKDGHAKYLTLMNILKTKYIN